MVMVIQRSSTFVNVADIIRSHKRQFKLGEVNNYSLNRVVYYYFSF